MCDPDPCAAKKTALINAEMDQSKKDEIGKLKFKCVKKGKYSFTCDEQTKDVASGAGKYLSISKLALSRFLRPSLYLRKLKKHFQPTLSHSLSLTSSCAPSGVT